MLHYQLEQLLQEQAAGNGLYHEFLRVPDLSVGLYVLPANQPDPQQPHAEDEVYYVISGRGQIHVSGEDQPVQAGSIVYVAAQEVHYFHSITENLSILVFFAPAEGSQIDNA